MNRKLILVHDIISADTDIPEVAGFNELLQSPPSRGGDPYVQWISRLHKPVARIYEQIIRRPLVACKHHLKVCVRNARGYGVPFLTGTPLGAAHIVGCLCGW